MKKNNTKVELKKYLSQKEKIKNTFISSCIILVVLTFLIFITYSYFIKDSGEINVGNTQAAVPDVEIIDRQIVENTNNQQVIYTIRNNSNTNTYSYNLGYYNVTGGAVGGTELYYKIPNEEYSHPEGIIKPDEEKKIYLVSSRIQDGYEFTEIYNIKINSGYEYTPIDIDAKYKKLTYSPLESTAELGELLPSFGTLDPYFDPNITDYNLIYNPEETEENISFTPYFYIGNGYLAQYEFPFSPNKNYSISVYAEDGTFIKTYYINGDIELDGTIVEFKFESYPSGIQKSISKSEGFADNETITFSFTQSQVNKINSDEYHKISWEYKDGDRYLYNNNPNNYYGVSWNGPVTKDKYFIHSGYKIPINYEYYIVGFQNGQGTTLKIYNIQLN